MEETKPRTKRVYKRKSTMTQMQQQQQQQSPTLIDSLQDDMKSMSISDDFSSTALLLHEQNAEYDDLESQMLQKQWCASLQTTIISPVSPPSTETVLINGQVRIKPKPTIVATKDIIYLRVEKLLHNEVCDISVPQETTIDSVAQLVFGSLWNFPDASRYHLRLRIQQLSIDNVIEADYDIARVTTFSSIKHNNRPFIVQGVYRELPTYLQSKR